jgi:hypothetical protein
MEGSFGQDRPSEWKDRQTIDRLGNGGALHASKPLERIGASSRPSACGQNSKTSHAAPPDPPAHQSRQAVITVSIRSNSCPPGKVVCKRPTRYGVILGGVRGEAFLTFHPPSSVAPLKAILRLGLKVTRPSFDHFVLPKISIHLHFLIGCRWLCLSSVIVFHPVFSIGQALSFSQGASSFFKTPCPDCVDRDRRVGFMIG